MNSKVYRSLTIQCQTMSCTILWVCLSLQLDRVPDFLLLHKFETGVVHRYHLWSHKWLTFMAISSTNYQKIQIRSCFSLLFNHKKWMFCCTFKSIIVSVSVKCEQFVVALLIIYKFMGKWFYFFFKCMLLWFLISYSCTSAFNVQRLKILSKLEVP